METLEELKNTFKKLQEESNNLYNKIRALENQEALSNFTVGDCYFDTIWNNLIKIVSIYDNYIYYICLDDSNISRDNIYIYDIEDWVKITSEQFKNAYLAVIKDIQDPDLEFRNESNFDIILKSIILESTIKEGLKYVSELQNILFGLDLNHGMEV